MGRPTKLTPETQRKFVDAIRVGAHYVDACHYAGISEDAFQDWMKRGEASSTEPFRGFSVAVKEAEGAAAVGWMAKIEKAANDGTWQAAAWKLERRYPERYGRMVHDVKSEVTGKDGGPIEITAVSQARDEVTRRLTLLAARERPALPPSGTDG